MMRSKFRTALWVALSFVVPVACGVTSGNSGSNTNWLSRCTDDGDCAGDYSCWCGVCTSTCEVAADDCTQTAAQCADLAELGCAPTPELDDGACLPGCSDDADCDEFGSGLSCESGVCIAETALDADPDSTADGGDGGADGGTDSGGTTGSDLPDLEPLSGPARFSLGFDFACVTRAGQVWCWGENEYGQTGAPQSDEVLPVARVEGLDNVADLAVGDQHACALTDDGSVFCWGLNDSGQTGPESAPAMTCSFDEAFDIPCQPTPTRVPGIEGATSLVANRTTTCASFDDGSFTCWGDTSYIDAEAHELDGGARGVSIGDYDFCAISRETNELWCDGNWAPNFDNGSALEVTQVALAHDHAGRPVYGCVLDINGRVDCWGRDEAGQRGTGGFDSPTPDENDPPAIAEGARMVKVGPAHACAIIGDGEVACWGKNEYGQTGVPPFTAATCGGFPCQPSPAPVAGVPPAVQLDVQNSTTCVLSEDAELYCWGGQDLGTPWKVPGPWEGGNDECDGIDQAIASELLALRQTVPRNPDCKADSDCVELDLAVGCRSGCASAPLRPDQAEPLTDELARIDDAYCGRAEQLGCNFQNPECPPSRGELACVRGYCVRFDADTTQCEDACACEVLSDLAEAPPRIADECTGYHLVLTGFLPCSNCDSSRQYFAVANQGREAFDGELSVELETSEAGLVLPEPMTLTLSLEPGEHSEPFYFEFDTGSGYATGRIVVPDNCTYQSEFSDVPMVVPPLPLCSE